MMPPDTSPGGWSDGGRVPVRDYKEKWGCYDEYARVLTSNGWKFFKDVDISIDLIASLVNGTTLEFVKATDYMAYHYSGDMYKIKTRGVDLLVTTNHKLYISGADKVGGNRFEGGYIRNQDTMSLQTYEKLFRKHKKFKKGAFWQGVESKVYRIGKYENRWNPQINNDFERLDFTPELELDMEIWLSLVGWYVAEGSSYNAQSDFSLNGNNDEPEIVAKLCKKLGFSPSVRRIGSSGKVSLYSKQLAVWFKENCGHLSQNKRVPAFIKDLSPRLIKIFLDSLMLEMGTKQKRLTHYQQSRRLWPMMFWNFC